MIDDALNNPGDGEMTTGLAFNPWYTVWEGGKQDPSYGAYHSACMCGRFGNTGHSQAVSEAQMRVSTTVTWNCILAGRDFDQAGSKDKDSDQDDDCVKAKKALMRQKKKAYKALRKQYW